MTRKELEKKVRALREYVEYNNSHGVYKSAFFALAGESLKATTGQPRQIRRAEATVNLLDKVDLLVQPCLLYTSRCV